MSRDSTSSESPEATKKPLPLPSISTPRTMMCSPRSMKMPAAFSAYCTSLPFDVGERVLVEGVPDVQALDDDVLRLVAPRVVGAKGDVDQPARLAGPGVRVGSPGARDRVLAIDDRQLAAPDRRRHRP